ncbi:MAG: nitroreductase family protein [Candidatus Hydrogenedentota bacterium]
MDAIFAIKNRRSVRKYSDKPIDKKILEDIVDCGRLAASARNICPFEFILLTDKKIIKEIAEITDYGKFMKDAAAGIVVICKETKYYLEDGCAATENILLAATAYNIGSCWIAGDKKPYADKILKRFNVPPEYKLISIISLGYPAEEITLPQKPALEKVIHYNKY